MGHSAAVRYHQFSHAMDHGTTDCRGTWGFAVDIGGKTRRKVSGEYIGYFSMPRSLVPCL